MVGRTIGSPIEMELFANERIIQVSGVGGAAVLQLYDSWQEFDFERSLNMLIDILGMIDRKSVV